MLSKKNSKFNKLSRRGKISLLTILSSICIFILMCITIRGNSKETNSLSYGQAIVEGPTVCLDAGHGGYDVGSISNSDYYEKDLALELTLMVGDILSNEGINVVYTRTADNVPWPSDNKKDLKQRLEISNNYESDIFVSIHYNHNDNSSYKGYESWTRFKDSEGDYLSKSILDELKLLNYSSNRGIKYESEKSLRVIKDNPAISALLELGFLSNYSDAAFLTSNSGKDQLAKAISEGILNYIDFNETLQ